MRGFSVTGKPDRSLVEQTRVRMAADPRKVNG